MRAPYDMTGASADAVRKRNQRKFTAPQKLVEGHARFYGISPCWPDATAACVILPIRTKAEGNNRESWRMASKRASAQRSLTALLLHQLGAADWRTQVNRVRFVRLAPKLMDDDNCIGSMKRIRDGVAAWIAGENHPKGKGDDGPSCGVVWEYAQETSTHYGVRIEIFVGS